MTEGSANVRFCRIAVGVVALAESKVRWNLRANDEVMADWLKGGLHRSMRVPVKPKPKFVKVIVYDPGSDRSGSLTLNVK